MAIKDGFSSKEWQTLEFSPFWVLGAMGTADGKLEEKEVEAFKKELADAPFYKDELVREVMLAIVMSLADVMAAYKADPRKVQEGLSDLANVLEKKSPEHAEAFKKVMLSIAVKVAGAEGKGKDHISQEEKVAFALLASMMRAKLD